MEGKGADKGTEGREALIGAPARASSIDLEAYASRLSDFSPRCGQLANEERNHARTQLATDHPSQR